MAAAAAAPPWASLGPDSDTIEFVAKSGRLTAKKVVGPEDASNLYSTPAQSSL
jgi:hypothetical protein